MTQFETLPLSATQANDDDIDPGFLVPDYGNVIPPFDEEIDPDFSVMPPYPDGVIPDRPYPKAPLILLFTRRSSRHRCPVCSAIPTTGRAEASGS